MTSDLRRGCIAWAWWLVALVAMTAALRLEVGRWPAVGLYVLLAIPVGPIIWARRDG